MNIRENTLTGFIGSLASKEPVPGGGGASALVGAVGAALCSMAANLTSGRKRYAQYQPAIDGILARISRSIPALLELIDKDAEAFLPLAAAYGIPKDDPGRDGTLESALVVACSVPMMIMKEVSGILEAIESLAENGSRLAVSDVGIAASACRCAMEGAAMNVYINTKLMKNSEYARQVNIEADALLHDGVTRYDAVYRQITDELRRA